MNNKIIRSTLKESNMKQWELADILGISEQTLVRRLRYEIPQEEQERIANLIMEASNEKEK